MWVHFLGSMMTESLFSSCWADYLVKSGGTGVVTKDCMGFRWTCWNMSRISGLFEISSLLLQEWSCSQTHTENKKTIWFIWYFSFYVHQQTILEVCSRGRMSKFRLTHLMLHFLQERLQQLRLLGQGCLLAWWRELQFYFQCWSLQEVSSCVGGGGLSASIHSVPINISYIEVFAAVIKRCIDLCILWT